MSESADLLLALLAVGDAKYLRAAKSDVPASSHITTLHDEDEGEDEDEDKDKDKDDRE